MKSQYSRWLCFRGALTYRPVLGIQWVIWAIERDNNGRLGAFLLLCCCCRNVVAVAGHVLKAILLATCKYFDLLGITKELLIKLALCDNSSEMVAWPSGVAESRVRARMRRY